MIKYQRITHDVDVLIPTLVDQFKGYREVDVLYLYGSRAGGRISPLSDVDLAVLVSKSLNKKEWYELLLALMGVAASTLKTDEVDLQILNNIPLQAQYSILKNKKMLFCRSESRRTEYEEEVVVRYLDFRPILDAQYEAMYRRIA